MDDARPVGVVDGVRERGEEAQHLLEGQASLLDNGLEGPALQELHDDVILADVVDAHDVRVGQPAGGGPLPAEPPKVLVAGGVGQVLGLYGLDGHGSRKQGIEPPIDPAHRPVADLSHDSVAAECSERHGPWLSPPA